MTEWTKCVNQWNWMSHIIKLWWLNMIGILCSHFFKANYGERCSDCAQYLFHHMATLTSLFVCTLPDIWHVNQTPINYLNSPKHKVFLRNVSIVFYLHFSKPLGYSFYNINLVTLSDSLEGYCPQGHRQHGKPLTASAWASYLILIPPSSPSRVVTLIIHQPLKDSVSLLLRWK